MYLKSEAVEPLDANSSFGLFSGKNHSKAWENKNAIEYQNVKLSHSLLRDVLFADEAESKFPCLCKVAQHFLDFFHYEIWGPESLRMPAQAPNYSSMNGGTAIRLGKHGEGLPRLVSSIFYEKDIAREFLREIQRSYPHIRGIGFKKGIHPKDLGLVFSEGFSSSSLQYQPSQMSDGFMRLLGLLALKYQPQPLTVMGYEEPENGLHPGALDDCMTHLKDIVLNGTQVIVTTHSPYLLNHLLEDENEPRAELHLVLRGKDGTTSIVKPNAAKVEQARRQGFGIGEIWGMLMDEKELVQA